MNRTSGSSLIAFAIFLISSEAAFSSPKVYTLTDLYRETVAGSESVRSSIEERTQIEETKSQAKGALLPTISGVASYSQAGDPSKIGAGFNGLTQKTAKLVGKEILFQGGSEYAFLAQTNRLIEGKEAEIAGSRIQYFVNLAAAYSDALLKQSLRNHAKTELDLYDTQIKELKSRVKIGRTRSSDLLSVQAARAGSEARVLAAENDFQSAKIALANLSRIPLDFELREDGANPTPLQTLQEYLKASEQRPDLVAARKRRDATQEGIAYRRGFHLPTLDVSGSYYLKREGYSNDSKWDATLTLTVPLFAGGITQSQVREAASAFRVAEINTGQLERGAELEIRTLHQTLLASEAELKSFSEAVELANKSYTQIQRDYKFGLVTNLDLLNSLQTLTNAKRSFDQSKFQHFLERVRLEAGAGRIPLANAS